MINAGTYNVSAQTNRTAIHLYITEEKNVPRCRKCGGDGKVFTFHLFGGDDGEYVSEVKNIRICKDCFCKSWVAEFGTTRRAYETEGPKSVIYRRIIGCTFDLKFQAVERRSTTDLAPCDFCAKSGNNGVQSDFYACCYFGEKFYVVTSLCRIHNDQLFDRLEALLIDGELVANKEKL